MSADLLRQAAALMRTRAEAVITSVDEWYSEPEMLATLRRGDLDNSTQPHDADHIASWHPAVALAVADLLEAVAEDWATASYGHWSTEVTTVARAYLGGAG